jgi:hypothetical protein
VTRTLANSETRLRAREQTQKSDMSECCPADGRCWVVSECVVYCGVGVVGNSDNLCHISDHPHLAVWHPFLHSPTPCIRKMTHTLAKSAMMRADNVERGCCPAHGGCWAVWGCVLSCSVGVRVVLQCGGACCPAGSMCRRSCGLCHHRNFTLDNTLTLQHDTHPYLHSTLHPQNHNSTLQPHSYKCLTHM